MSAAPVIVSETSDIVSPTLVRTRSCAASWRRCNIGSSTTSGTNDASAMSPRCQS
jgi:hypothetical protein